MHNHLRQGLLNIEDAWGTQTWWHRLAAKFIGIIVSDALIAYNYEYSVSHTMRDFVNELALSLIFNEMEGHDTVQQRRQSGESVPPTAPPPVPHMAIPFHAHPLRKLVQLSLYKGKVLAKEGARRKCVSCNTRGEKRNAHFYCATCSDESREQIVAVCGHGSSRGTECHAFH